MQSVHCNNGGQTEMAAKQIYGPQKSPIANQIKKICKGSKSESLKFSFLAFSEATTEHKAQQIPPSIFHLLAVICSLLKSLFLLLWAFVSSRVLHWGHTQAAVGNSCTAFTAEATLPGAAIPKALHAIVTLPIAWGGEKRIRAQTFPVPAEGNRSAFRQIELRTSSLIS